jgi:acetate---CoA ligase (ADP-forming)
MTKIGAWLYPGRRPAGPD